VLSTVPFGRSCPSPSRRLVVSLVA
jgi:hypothetical protein